MTAITIVNSGNIAHTEDIPNNKITFSHQFTLSNGKKITTVLTYNAKDVADPEKFKKTLFPLIKKSVEISIAYGLGSPKANKFEFENDKLSRFKDGAKVNFKREAEKQSEYKDEAKLDKFLTEKKQKLAAADATKTNKKERLSLIEIFEKFTPAVTPEKPKTPEKKSEDKPSNLDKPKPKTQKKETNPFTEEDFEGLKKSLERIEKTGFTAFYKNGPTAFLSNFAPCKIEVFGKKFQCSEAAFQWMKYQFASEKNAKLRDDPILNEFFTATGEKAFELMEKLDKKYPKSSIYTKEWLKEKRDRVMWLILQAKFSQNAQYCELLNATKDSYLLEHTEKVGGDSYWSDNHDGTGANMLGKMLMAVRDGKRDMPKNDNSDEEQIKKYAAAYKKQGYKIF